MAAAVAGPMARGSLACRCWAAVQPGPLRAGVISRVFIVASLPASAAKHAVWWRGHDRNADAGQIDEAGTNLAQGPATNEATVNTREITPARNGSGWSYPLPSTGTPASPEPHRTGDRGGHPALK